MVTMMMIILYLLITYSILGTGPQVLCLIYAILSSQLFDEDADPVFFF